MNAELDFAKGNGLVNVVTQDARSGVVLMLAHADRDAIARCIATGEMHYFSRSRGPWHKGATSGNTQRVVTLLPDCDKDAVLAKVLPAGPACHTGSFSCFGEQALDANAFSAVAGIVQRRALDNAPSGSYTAALLGDRNKRLKKLGEEAAEFIAACADGDGARAAHEAADLIYHVAVALQASGSSLNEVADVLAARRQQAEPAKPART